MMRNLATSLIKRPDGKLIVVLKAPRGTFRAPWDAARAVAALKARLPSDQLGLDIVAMDGDPSKNPKLFGSSDASYYIRNALPSIAAHTWPWSPTTLDC